MNLPAQFPARTLVLAALCFITVVSVGHRLATAAVGDGQIQQAALRHDTFDSFYRTPFGATTYYSDAYADDNDNLNQGGEGAPSSSEPFTAFRLTVYEPNFQTPAWLQVAPRSGTVLSALQTFSITGRLTNRNGQPVSGVSVELSGAQNGTSVTDANGNYGFFNLNANVNYTVTPSQFSGFNFSPASVSFNNLSADQVANFVVLPPTVSGRVTFNGAGLSDVVIILRGPNTGSTTGRTDANGNYSVPYTPDISIQVTPVRSTFVFNPASVTFVSSRGVSGNQTANFIGASAADTGTVQFASASYTVGEDGGRAAITVTRTGNTNGGAIISYETVDDPAAVRCDDTTTKPGVAFARCDYATSVDTLLFSGGETSKTINVPIIDDAHVEPNETVTLRLTKPVGVLTGAQSTATLTITDNDTPGQANPIFTTPFFVRQQYLDFLSREPEQGEPWSNVLNHCPDVNNTDPNSPSATCDRITVSAAFFGSPEFQLKGFYVFLFYKVGLQRLPQYAEIIPDMRSVTGATADEVFAKRAAYAMSFTERADFHAAYDDRNDTQYVARLLAPYGLTSITTPDPANPEADVQVTLTQNELVSRLTAGTLTRAQVLRAVVQSQEILNREFNNAFVAMQYYGYLRRTPDTPGLNAWLNYLTAHPMDFRTMVNGFMNSQEYRLRFGAAQ